MPRYDEAPKVVNRHPSTAFLDSKGVYHPCPKNQPGCFAPTDDNRATPKDAYCKAHKQLGCEECP